jgi:hypothetical protein
LRRLRTITGWPLRSKRLRGFSRRQAGQSSFLAFHLGSGGLLKHTVRDERVHELEVLADLDEAVGDAADFYSAPERVLKNLSPTRLSPARVDETFFSQDPAFISARLLQSNVPVATAAALTDAIVNQRFWGAIARVDHEPGAAPVAEHRVSLLRGATDLWMLRPRKVGGEWFIELSPGSRQTLEELFSGILSE